MALTYEPIATTTLGTATATITFSSIPQTYTDLRVVFSGGYSTITSLFLRLNSDIGANYTTNSMYSQNTSPTGLFDTGLTYVNVGAIIQPSVIDIFKYTTSGTYYRSMLLRSSGTYSYLNERRATAYWLSTAAVTTVTLTSSAGTFSVGTNATIYGIKAA